MSTMLQGKTFILLMRSTIKAEIKVTVKERTDDKTLGFQKWSSLDWTW